MTVPQPRNTVWERRSYQRASASPAAITWSRISRRASSASFAASASTIRSCWARLLARSRGLSCSTSAETLRGNASLMSRMVRASRSFPAISWMSAWNRSLAAVVAGASRAVAQHVVGAAQLVELFGRDLADGAHAGEALQLGPHLEGLADLPRRRHPHHRTAPGQDLDQPAGLELAQRFPDRGAADAESGGQVSLAQLGADRDLPGHDPRADRGGGLVDECVRLPRGRVGIHGQAPFARRSATRIALGYRFGKLGSSALAALRRHSCEEALSVPGAALTREP